MSFYKTYIPLILVWLIAFPIYAVDVDGLLSPSAQELSDSGKLDEPLLNMIIDHGSKDLLTRRYKVLIIPQQAISDNGSNSSLSLLNQRIRSAADSVLGTVRNQNDFELRLRFRSINVIAADAGLQSLLALAADSSVRQIGLDASGRGGLNQAIPQVNIDKVRQTYGYTGDSIEVAVLDTGIDTDHVDLQGIIASQKCLADVCPNGADNAEDDNGHGTHVSGIIASQGTASPTGAAPGVRIHAVKVLDSSNRFSAASIVLSGLDYVINDLPNVDIVNMSLGTDLLFDTDCDTQYSFTRAFSDAITTLRDRGVLSFVSSMNDASDNSIAAPACISNAIAVGAVYDTQPSSYYGSACNEINPAADTLTCFSNSSVSLDLVAPGSPITSTRRGGGTTIYSGTSMSTPLAAACAALIMEHDSTWSVDEIEAVLETSDVIVTDREGREFPRLDCMGFLKKTQDTDGDGVADSSDAFPLDASESVDTDSDGTGNNADTDDDNDGVLDGDDAFPLNASETLDTDLDGTGNNADLDDDGDGVLDGDDPYPLNAPPTLTFTYGDNSSKPIVGITLTLTESDTTVTTLTSDANGQVKLPLDPTATNTYTLAASFTDTGTDPISVQDALYILQHIVELRTLDSLQFKAADINGSGDITIQDALKVLQHNVELITIDNQLVFLDADSDKPLFETTYKPTDTPSIKVYRLGDVNLSFSPGS